MLILLGGKIPLRTQKSILFLLHYTSNKHSENEIKKTIPYTIASKK